MVITRSPETRLDRTLTFIHDTPLFDQTMRHAVSAYADSYIGRAQWATGAFTLPSNLANGTYKQFSAEMTMTDVHSPGNEPQRAMRRSMFLLWSAMGNSHAAARAKSILVADVQDEFIETMWKALCVADEANGQARGPEAVYRRLRHDPLGFMADNPVMVAGSTTVSLATNTNPIDFVFRYDRTQEKYLFEDAANYGGGVGKFVIANASSVVALPWQQVPGRGNAANNGSFATIRSTHLAGKLMVTTQLTGCTFTLQDAGGTLCCAHLKPGGGVDGTALAQQLDGQVATVVRGAYSNLPGATANPFYVFGRGYSTLPKGAGGYDARISGGGDYATVIGIQRQGVWHLYAQENVNRTIINVREIW